MGNPPITSGPQTISFKRQLPFRSGAAGIVITGTKDPAILQAIILDNAFPETADITLGNISVNAQAGQDLTFATGTQDSFRNLLDTTAGVGGVSGDVQQSSALFRFLALKPDANFQPGDFLQGQMPQDGILIQQSIVNA